MIWTAHPLAQLRHARFVRRRLNERASGIRTALRTAPAGHVALVGDSHAEFLGAPDFGDRAVVNLGVGGSTAADCAHHLAGLRPVVEAAAAVLFVGTNDALRWQRPSRPGAADRFGADVDAILRAVAGWGAHIFVAAVPPVGAWVANRDPAVTVALSERLRAACARGGATFFDPFAAMRGPVPGLASAGLHPDGVHMADYAGLAAEVSRFVGLHLTIAQACTAPTAAASALLTKWVPPAASGRTFGAAVRAAARPRP